MKKVLGHILLLMPVLAMGITAFAADKRPITAQDLWALKRLGSPALSPDGRTVVFTVQEWATGKNVPITQGLDYSFDEYQFSSDGRSLWLLAEERGYYPCSG